MCIWSLLATIKLSQGWDGIMAFPRLRLSANYLQDSRYVSLHLSPDYLQGSRCISLPMSAKPWPVRHVRPCQQLGYYHHSSWGHWGTQALYHAKVEMQKVIQVQKPWIKTLPLYHAKVERQEKRHSSTSALTTDTGNSVQTLDGSLMMPQANSLTTCSPYLFFNTNT